MPFPLPLLPAHVVDVAVLVLVPCRVVVVGGCVVLCCGVDVVVADVVGDAAGAVVGATVGGVSDDDEVPCWPVEDEPGTALGIVVAGSGSRAKGEGSAVSNASVSRKSALCGKR